MRVGVVGLGYVGLVLSLHLASIPGVTVDGIETDVSKIRMLRDNRLPIAEPKLEELLTRLNNTKFVPTVQYNTLTNSDIVFVTVNTPSTQEGVQDLSPLRAASAMIGNAIKSSRRNPVVVVKSTVLPGTTRKVVGPVIEATSKLRYPDEFGLAVNPEFMSEGNALDNLECPDFILIGTEDEVSRSRLTKLYKRVYDSDSHHIPIVQTGFENAELVKYASNLIQSVKISCVNELAMICQVTPHADVDVISRCLALDKSVGPFMLSAGPGWGGSCFRKDVSALIRYAHDAKLTTLYLAEANLRSNESAKKSVVHIVEQKLKVLRGKKVAILGLAFKAETNDGRDSPALDITSALLDKGAKVSAYDPREVVEYRSKFGSLVIMSNSIKECVFNCDAIIILTDAKEFKQSRHLLFNFCKRNGVIVDTRRILGSSQNAQRGIKVVAVGRYHERAGRNTYPPVDGVVYDKEEPANPNVAIDFKASP